MQAEWAAGALCAAGRILPRPHPHLRVRRVALASVPGAFTPVLRLCGPLPGLASSLRLTPPLGTPSGPLSAHIQSCWKLRPPGSLPAPTQGPLSLSSQGLGRRGPHLPAAPQLLPPAQQAVCQSRETPPPAFSPQNLQFELRARHPAGHRRPLGDLRSPTPSLTDTGQPGLSPWPHEGHRSSTPGDPLLLSCSCVPGPAPTRSPHCPLPSQQHTSLECAQESHGQCRPAAPGHPLLDSQWPHLQPTPSRQDLAPSLAQVWS